MNSNITVLDAAKVNSNVLEISEPYENHFEQLDLAEQRQPRHKRDKSKNLTRRRPWKKHSNFWNGRRDDCIGALYENIQEIVGLEVAT